ncbi:SRPBCC domain-containing protein [Streptomyces physcomitrii]|uniref:Polyketide cyclase n=1 Tax=Streptomyces physcomitrii TaxID=2724184 RepID=A0ABX1GVR8_9ACTN|nr:SRPBCC domain-containing protein [Streptomyces physcomitrii]NKI40182.1 polyketide cyclase [Streptomyces physcomitrii]
MSENGKARRTTDGPTEPGPDREPAAPADRIEREVRIAAPIERVWAVLTEPGHVGEWFGQGAPAQIDLRPGGIMQVDHGSAGQFPTKIVKVDPPQHFAYLWASGYPGDIAVPGNATLVEFTLAAEGERTLLHLTESGFTEVPVPPEHPEASYESHVAGWNELIEVLRTYAERTGR